MIKKLNLNHNLIWLKDYWSKPKIILIKIIKNKKITYKIIKVNIIKKIMKIEKNKILIFLYFL